ncbi:RICIN domain-containing protein [Hymenobacter sp. BT188]|uniref:RICIN domain-containing protein n=1 Tax=Hymenobacter sp. BT188 TaxID=2763504 RepID=UPI0016519D88|nr:RICIN domain-containing protein [Hymenobacter sp. BT188]MBC6605671.1 RICIN domain-containing protein [Hymenobacter sp. BT188]
MHIRHLTPAPARRVTSHWTLFSWLLLLLTGAAHTSIAQDYQGPLRITRGGTYSGNWESNDSNTPAVSIETSEPVVIENANIRSRGILIRAHQPGSHVTVRNTNGYGLTPSQDNVRYGRFIDATNFRNIRVEHNYIDHTSGIYLAGYQGNHSGDETVKILYNKVTNIDGRFRNSGMERVQFVQFNSVRQVRGVEIAWNQVINEPYKSRVEENINFYLSNGTSDSPILIHNNYIQGAYPANPGSETDYGGGGINMGDGNTSDFNASPGFMKAFDNHIVSTGTQGICVSAGHDMEFYNNRIINSGYLADGTYIRCNNVGIYIMKSGGSNDIFQNNRAYNNTVGYVNRNANGDRQRNDQYLPDANERHNYSLNIELPFLITRDTEKAEYVIWENKLRNNGVVIGPTSGSPAPTPSPTPAPAPAPTPGGSSEIVSGGTYKLVGKGSNKVLDVDNNSNNAGAKVQIWDDNGSTAQRFVITLQSDGTYKLTHKGTSQVLDVDNNSDQNGAKVQQWDDNGSSAQRWIITSNGDGSFKLMHKGTNKVLDVDNNNSHNGAKVQQWDDNGSTAQRWVLVRDGSSISSNATLSAVSTSNVTAASSFATAKTTNDLAIYPNPAADYVMLPTGTDYVQIVAQSGKTVLEKRGALAQRLNIQSLANGLYQVRVGEKGKISTQRLEVK